MIYESYYWKKELATLAKKLNKKTLYKRTWTDAQDGAFEKEIMIGFYIIRKLIESKKLTNKLVSTKLAGRKYPNKGKLVTLNNKHRFDKYYDFDKPQNDKFSLPFLINQIIHSYIFSPQFFYSKSYLQNMIDKKVIVTTEIIKELSDTFGLISILFCSDDRRNEFLFELDILTIVSLFESVSNCYVTTTHQEYNPSKKDYDMFQTDEVVPIPKEIEEIIKQQKKKL